MKSKHRYLILIFIALAVILSLVGILKNTSWAFNGINSNSPLEISTSFPNANCTKTLKKQFPFYELKCTPKDADENLKPEAENQEQEDKLPQDDGQEKVDENQTCEQ